MFRIYPYKVGSASARRLRDSLGGRLIKLENTRYRPRSSHTIINWGNSRRPDWAHEGVTMMNEPEYVAVASNKLRAFNQLNERGVPTVPFTTDFYTAQEWLLEGSKVFARHSLSGHSGEGIHVIEPNADNSRIAQIAQQLADMGHERLSSVVFDEVREVELPTAPLYTRAVSNSGEYRVHVFNGEVILYQKKSRRVDDDGNVITAEGEEADVRNLASNWVYRTGNLRRLERIEQLAISAIEALGLDFGAVDIIKDNNLNVYVLEVNSAPGLVNDSTLQAYIDALSN